MSRIAGIQIFPDTVQLQDNHAVNHIEKFLAGVTGGLGNLIAAAEQTGSQKLVLAGGVSANRLLRRRAEEVCRARGWKLYMPERAFCGDNGAMIASQGYYEFLAGHTAGMELNASANADLAEPGCF